MRFWQSLFLSEADQLFDLTKIAEELGLSRNETMALRSGWKEHLAEFQGLKQALKK